jgi:hypothetical protein
MLGAVGTTDCLRSRFWFSLGACAERGARTSDAWETPDAKKALKRVLVFQPSGRDRVAPPLHIQLTQGTAEEFALLHVPPNATEELTINGNSVVKAIEDLGSGLEVTRYVLFTVAILLAAVRVSTASVSAGYLRGAIVAESYLPVRSSPAMVTATTAQLYQGDDVNLTGVRSADGRWVQVRLVGVDAGWVLADAVRVRFPIADLVMTDDPALAIGQEIGGVAVVTAQRSAVLENVGATRNAMMQLARGEQVQLAGYRTADEKWVQVVLPDNRIGWVDAISISSDYPLSALSEIDAVTKE